MKRPLPFLQPLCAGVTLFLPIADDFVPDGPPCHDAMVMGSMEGSNGQPMLRLPIFRSPITSTVVLSP